MSLPEWAKWMARDNDGTLCAYSKKPYKSFEMGEWLSYDSMCRVSEVATPFDNVKWSDEEPTEIVTNTLKDVNPIEPGHYNKGEIDLYESAYRTRPFNETRAILEFVAERYMKRDKINRLEDIDKAIYTLQRLRAYEVLELEKNLPPIELEVEE